MGIYLLIHLFYRDDCIRPHPTQSGVNPPIDFLQIVVLAFNPGPKSEALHDDITIPLEDALGSIERIVNIESTTSNREVFISAMNEFGSQFYQKTLVKDVG